MRFEDGIRRIGELFDVHECLCVKLYLLFSLAPWL